MTADAHLLPFRGNIPSIDPTAFVAPGATLVGSVTLAAGSSVFYGAVLRADVDTIRLGEGSNLQDNVSVHCDAGKPTTIGRGVSVGHGAVIHGCTIEDHVLIGMSATVLNEAVIGRDSLIAAGTVVLEGTVIPERSLVAGVPGKVRRALTDDEVQKVHSNAELYVALAAEHLAAWADLLEAP